MKNQTKINRLMEGLTEDLLAEILCVCFENQERILEMSAVVDALAAEVAVAVSNIQELAAKVAAIPADESARIAELTAQLKAATDAVAAPAA